MSGAPRIVRRFEALRRRGGGLVTFLTAGDPDRETALAIMRGLPAAGADIIELGMPFSDPMADGPAIQASSLRALRAGMTVAATLQMVEDFRSGDDDTPVILMGYFNPVYRYGVERFVRDAAAAGVDGLIIVDLPPEECEELWQPARNVGLDLIFLIAPTSDDRRLPTILGRASGFVYYVSITGVTGTAAPDADAVAAAVGRIRRATPLPVAVGFGITSPAQVSDACRVADAAVVGSALVRALAETLGPDDTAGTDTVTAVLDATRALAGGIRNRALADGVAR